ncbi:MAG: acyP [Planctomycetota bacterium]|nr:acyP [Planctomycetota bacterium]
MMATEHRRAVYRGRVQGVGFRATTRRLATGFAVSGYVRNLPDGTVEVIASGEAGELDGFLDAIDREFAGKVRDRSISPIFPESVELSGFAIRY